MANTNWVMNKWKCSEIDYSLGSGKWKLKPYCDDRNIMSLWGHGVTDASEIWYNHFGNVFGNI